MTVFPQLVTGALAQFACEKRLYGRAVISRAADASTFAAADPDGRRVGWNLAYTGLTVGEFGALKDLFDASEGRLNTFLFLDPMANLLGWTEDLSAAAWHADALLGVSAGAGGPAGNSFQLANSGAGWAELSQTLPAPTDFVYAFSIWARGTGALRLRRSIAGDSEEVEFALTPDWRRIQLNGAFPSVGLGISFSIGLPAAGVAEVAGPQVEAQLTAGAYKPSLGRGGIYPAARFGTDQLLSRVEAPDWIDSQVTIESRFEGI